MSSCCTYHSSTKIQIKYKKRNILHFQLSISGILYIFATYHTNRTPQGVHNHNTNTMKIKKGFELQDVCGEYILVPADIEDTESDKAISLDPVAALLWAGVEQMELFTIDNMVEILLSEYEVEEEIAREDCGLIIERWDEMGIIEK